jgi:hypothetical protein
MDTQPDPAAGSASEDDSDTEGTLGSEVVQYEEEPDRRTLFPVDVDEDDLLTHWLTANDGSFVDLREFR